MPPKRDPSTSTAADAGAHPSNDDSDSSDDELYAFKIKLKELSIFLGNLLASISAKE